MPYSLFSVNILNIK